MSHTQRRRVQDLVFT